MSLGISSVYTTEILPDVVSHERKPPENKEQNINIATPHPHPTQKKIKANYISVWFFVVKKIETQFATTFMTVDTVQLTQRSVIKHFLNYGAQTLSTKPILISHMSTLSSDKVLQSSTNLHRSEYCDITTLEPGTMLDRKWETSRGSTDFILVLAVVRQDSESEWW